MSLEQHTELKSRDMEDILFDVVSDVLEQFAFMFTDPVEKSEFKPASNGMMHAQLIFKGPFMGALSMYASLSFCLQLAANVLGEDAEDMTNEHAADALKELVNVTCGELLVTVAGKNMIFDLGIPRIRRQATEEVMSILSEPGIQPLMVDDQPMLVRVEIEPQV